MAEERGRKRRIRAGGKHTAALDLVHGKIRVSVNGDKPDVFEITKLTATHLAAGLNRWPTSEFGNIVMVGTAHDGSPGWDSITTAQLRGLTSHEFTSLTEAEALHLQHEDDSQEAGYLILATNKQGRGSARWWVAKDGEMTAADVTVHKHNFGPLYISSGGSVSATPRVLAAIVGQFLACHTELTRLYVWSQQGLEHVGVYGPQGRFWRILDPRYTERITAFPSPYEPVQIASRPPAFLD